MPLKVDSLPTCARQCRKLSVATPVAMFDPWLVTQQSDIRVNLQTEQVTVSVIGSKLISFPPQVLGELVVDVEIIAPGPPAAAAAEQLPLSAAF